MKLSGIGDYLEIYRKRLFSAEDQKKIIIHAIKTVSGIYVDEKDVTIDRTIVSVKTDSVTRSQLFFYKKKILEEIKKNSSKPITDVQ